MIKAEKIFDMAAKNYENAEEKRFKQYTTKTIEMTGKYLKPEDIVLDYGCATGTKAIGLAGKVKKIYGIDISSKMIELANIKKAQCRINNVDFIKTTIFDERFKEESFDAVLVFNILHLLKDDRKIVERITGLLKPGGLLISTTPCLGEKMAFFTKLQFSFFLLLIKIRLFPSIRRYKFFELEDLIASKSLQIIDSEKFFHEMYGYFITAKKIPAT